MLTDPHMQLDFYELDLPFVVYGRHNFVAEEEDEITFAAADPVVVLERDELYSDGWWRGRNRQGHVGLFPKNFIAFDPPSKTSPPQPKQTSADHLPSPALSQHYVFPNPPVSDEVDSVAGTLQRQSLSFTPGTPPEISKDLANLEDRYSTLSRTPAAAPNAHPKTWNPRDVENWLSREGFEFAIRYFKQTPITGQALLDLNLSSLRELGMESLSDRINILHQILALKEDFPDLPTPESARESPQVSRTCPTGSSHQTVQGTPSPARESLATSSHGPAAVASLRGSVLGSSSASGSRPPSPPATCLEKNRDQKEGSAGNARSQDSGFVEQAEEDLGKPQYPIRQDSWGQGAISPIIAPNDLPPPEQQRRLRKPASDFTLSDYFYGSETGGDDQDRDGEEEEDYHLTLPPLELPTGKHTSVENKDGEATLVRSPDRANRVGGMVGVTGSPLMEEQTVNEGRGQDSPKRQRSLRLMTNITRSLSKSNRHFRKSAESSNNSSNNANAAALGLSLPYSQSDLHLAHPPMPDLPPNLKSTTRTSSPATTTLALSPKSPTPSPTDGGLKHFASPDYTGDLEVRANGAGRWKKRYCVIDNAVLWILKSKDNPKETLHMTLTPDTQVLPSHPTPSHPYTFYVRDTHTGVQCNAESQLAMVSWLNILVRAGQHTERTRPVTLIPIRPQQQQQQMQPGEKPASRIPVTAAAYPERLSNGIDAKMVMGMNKHYHHHHHPRRMPEEEEAISNNNNNNNNNSIRDGAISPAGSVDSRLTNKDIRNSTTINNNNNNNNTNNNNNSINRPAGPAKNGLFAAAEH